jgi:hypothetical protein
MAKRPSLAERMRGAVATDGATNDEPPAAVTHHMPQEEKFVENTERFSRFHAPTRAGKKKVTAPLAPAAHKQLKQLGLDLDLSVETLLLQAINDLFKKHGKAPIA